MKRLVLLALLLPSVAFAQAGGTSSNAGALWGQDINTGLPCVVAPVGGSTTCASPVLLPSGAIVRATSTIVNGTITTANTFQLALAASSTRRGCLIVNKSVAPLILSQEAVGVATAPRSVVLSAGTATTDGGSFNCASPSGLVVTDPITVTSATISAAYLVISQ